MKVDNFFKGRWVGILVVLVIVGTVSKLAYNQFSSKRPVVKVDSSNHTGNKRGGTFVTGWPTEPLGVNELIFPSTAVGDEVLFQTFQHLLQEKPNFTVGPPTFDSQLADKNVEWSADHKTLTLRLLDNLVWSDGVKLTAEDVRFSWQAQTHVAVAWGKAFMKAKIRDVEAVDPRTIRFHFREAYAKQLLDVNEGVILPKHIWSQLPFEKWRESADWFIQHRVAAGPFKIESWIPQQEMVLVRNEYYWQKDRPYLDRVILRFIPDASSLTAQLLNGELDFIAQVSPHDAIRIRERPDFDVLSFWSNLYVVIAWNNTRPLFTDPEIRRALTLAINRQEIVDTLLPDGTGRVGVSPILQEVWAHDKTLRPWRYDLAEAKRILEAKGWRDTDGDGMLDRRGQKFSFELVSNAGNQLRNDAAVMIQNYLRRAKIEAKPRILEFNALVTEARSGNFDAAIMGIISDTSLDLSGNYHENSIGKGDNYFRYSNSEVNRLIDKAASQRSIAEALPFLHQIERVLHRDQPVTFLWESQRLAAINRRLHGAEPNLLAAFFNLKNWWVDPRP